MLVLAFNHFFDQDLDALRAGLGAAERLVEIPYQRLHRLARTCFPVEAFVGVEPAVSGEYAKAWDRYHLKARLWAEWLIAAYCPNVFVVPTDAIFYVRPVISHLRARGIPTVVVQKETTISPMVMDEHAPAVGRSVPFMSDRMTVCSERQRDFWIRAGADPATITVTGQPRFDVYARPDLPPTPRSRPSLLYLSYDDMAYLPSDTGLAYDGSWQQLRLETERVLDSLTDQWDIVVKPHPQQGQTATALGPLVQRAPRDADTRFLILHADAVVGFQTTALFEAAAAGRPVVYAAWGTELARARHLLIPFDDHAGLATWARSPTGLEEILRLGPERLPRPTSEAAPAIAANIGVVDGQASQRVLDVIRRTSSPASPRSRPPLRRLLRAAAVATGAPALSVAAVAAGELGRHSSRAVLARRSRHWAQEGKELASLSRRALRRTRSR